MVRLCGCWLGKHSHTIIAIQSKYPIMGSMEIQFHWMESCAKLMFYTSHAYPPTKQKEKEKKEKEKENFSSFYEIISVYNYKCVFPCV